MDIIEGFYPDTIYRPQGLELAQMTMMGLPVAFHPRRVAFCTFMWAE